MKASQSVMGFAKSKTTLGESDLRRSEPIHNALTGDIKDLLNTVDLQLAQGRELREHARILIDDSMDNASHTAKRVDDLFVKKVAETATLGVNINLTLF